MLELFIINWALWGVSLIAGVAIERARYYKKLSEKDLFTGCFNKDWAITRKNSKLVRMMKSTTIKGASFGLAFIDFDDFRETNNDRGHPYGDQVILATVGAVNRSVEVEEKKGMLIRYGGDELMLLLPNINKEELILTCEDIVWRVSICTGHTVSIGGAIFNRGDGIDVQQFVKKADKNLYAAKEKGKDCAVVA